MQVVVVGYIELGSGVKGAIGGWLRMGRGDGERLEVLLEELWVSGWG